MPTQTTDVAYADIAPHLPTSITQPLAMGLTRDGELDQVPLMGKHWLIGARIGGGLSNQLHTAMANLANCQDTVVWGTDPLGGRRLGPWLPRIDWLATDQNAVDNQLRSLQELVAFRAAKLTPPWSHWEPTPLEPAIVYVISEGNQVTGVRAGQQSKVNADRLEFIVSRGRALGVYTIFATNYPNLDALGSSPLRDHYNVNWQISNLDQLASGFLGTTPDPDDRAWLNPSGTYSRASGNDDLVFGRAPHMPTEHVGLSVGLALAAAERAPRLVGQEAGVLLNGYKDRHKHVPAGLATWWRDQGWKP